MGLKSDKNGVKAQLKSRYPQAFREYDSLVDARNASMAKREETFSCVDGNVLMMSMPQNVRTLDAYVTIVTSSLKKMIGTCWLTVVVFDNPDCLTDAKKQEQARRDATKASTAVVCSKDISCGVPTDDDYDKKHILEVLDIRALVTNRATRNRFFDEVAIQVLENLELQIKRWKDAGYTGGHILFDGIDPRGAARSPGEPRLAQIVGSSYELAELFASSLDIGEGDLKLAYIGRIVRELSLNDNDSFNKTKLSLCTTIDTDSFAIELIEESKRRDADKNKQCFNTLICMRERASNKRVCEDNELKAYFLCCDVSLLYSLLQHNMWGISRSPSESDRHAAMTLLCAGWAMCGCDFVECKGMRSDVVFDCIQNVVSDFPEAIENTKYAWSGKREHVQHLYAPIRVLANACASRLECLPRVKKDVVSSLRILDEVIVKRTAWLICYWNSCEFKGELNEFGFVTMLNSMHVL
jgi:hypothetical protein